MRKLIHFVFDGDENDFKQTKQGKVGFSKSDHQLVNSGDSVSVL